jgi:hypothetical protein
MIGRGCPPRNDRSIRMQAIRPKLPGGHRLAIIGDYPPQWDCSTCEQIVTHHHAKKWTISVQMTQQPSRGLG